MKSFVPRLIVLGVLLATPSALKAQPTNGPGYRPQAPKTATTMQPPDVAGYAIGGPIGVLDDQQRASYFAAIKNERSRLQELQTKLLVARQDVLVTSVAQKFDENVIRQKALAAAQIEAEIAVIRARVFSQVQPPLSPQQIEKIKTGQTTGPVRPLGRQQIERPAQHAPSAGTNADANGLPPKK